MLSDFEDDIGEDLPSISLSQSTGEKSVTEMPPAAEVASERARRAAAEQALRELREPPPAAAPPPPAPAPAAATPTTARGAVGGARGAARARGCCGSCARGWGRRPGGPGPGAGPGCALLDAWLRACQRGPDGAAAVTEQMLSGIILGLESTGGAKGTVAAAAWLLAVACTGGAGAGARAGGAAGARDARCTSC
ncbi:uncharacterized protein [Choristoneura fumiferana]|uniref:uncharacterized protein n=1 Tax=Choristoneura fumiferana TaxID=7141 RepID=UPI003D155071